MRILGGAWLMLVLWSATAAGGDVFVDNMAGDDRATGQQPQSTPEMVGPVRSIARALTLAGNGDAIILAPTQQPYRESISLVGRRASGSAGQPFTIRGNGAILDGSAPVPPDAWEHHEGPVFRFRPPRTGSAQLFLDDRPAARVTVAEASGEAPKLAPRQWRLSEGLIYFCVDPTKLPGDYRLTYTASQTGITLFHVDHVSIVDLTVQGFRLDGISLQNSARDVLLLGVTCRGNGRSGVSVGGASRVEIDRSLLGDNGEAQLLTLPYSETHVRDSHLLSNTAPGWVDQGGHAYFGRDRRQGGLDEYHPTAVEENKP